MIKENSHCSSGPVSSLPGAVSRTTQQCDDHPDRAAVRCVQGETDSMGCEYMHLCQDCVTALALPVRVAGRCDWCHDSSGLLRHHRDADEGTSGPVYRVCCDCIAKETSDAREAVHDGHDEYDFCDSRY